MRSSKSYYVYYVFVVIVLLLCVRAGWREPVLNPGTPTSPIHMPLDTVRGKRMAPNGYYFPSYSVDMTVRPDNSFQVREHISTFFLERSHGLFRMLPNYTWVKRDASEAQDNSHVVEREYQMDYHDITVSEDYVDEGNSEGVRSLRIGSASQWIEGLHNYDISYVCQAGNDELPQADLLYYSVLGSGMGCEIDTFSFCVHFQKPVPALSLQKLQVYCGVEGNSYDHSQQILTQVDSTTVSGYVTGLKTGHAVTLFMPLPEGYFSDVPPLIYPQLAWGALGVAIVLLLFVLYRELTSADEHVTRVLTFKAPEGMSSADMGTLYDGDVDKRDIISLFPWFASRGYCTIDASGAHPVIRKIRDYVPDEKNAPAHLKKFFEGMFPDKVTEFDLGKDTDSKFGEGWLDCMQRLHKLHLKGRTHTDYWTAFGLLLAAVATAFAMGWSNYHEYAAPVAFCMLIAISLVSALNIALPPTTIARALMLGVVNGATLLLFFQLHHLYFAACSYIPMTPVLCTLFLMAVCCMLSVKLVTYTKNHAQVMGELEGFRQFILTAEQPQLEMLQAEDEKYFYNVLPYAVAFGLADKWAEKFKDIRIPEPDWYKGDDSTLTMWQMAHLNRTLNTSGLMSGVTEYQTERMEAQARSSSGGSHHSSGNFGGGGFGYSGGGFGGGGAGRW